MAESNPALNRDMASIIENVFSSTQGASSSTDQTEPWKVAAVGRQHLLLSSSDEGAEGAEHERSLRVALTWKFRR